MTSSVEYFSQAQSRTDPIFPDAAIHKHRATRETLSTKQRLPGRLTEIRHPAVCRVD
jgi:hypothetical protein